jgi:hypothetical protein
LLADLLLGLGGMSDPEGGRAMIAFFTFGPFGGLVGLVLASGWCSAMGAATGALPRLPDAERWWLPVSPPPWVSGSGPTCTRTMCGPEWSAAASPVRASVARWPPAA